MTQELEQTLKQIEDLANQPPKMTAKEAAKTMSFMCQPTSKELKIILKQLEDTPIVKTQVLNSDPAPKQIKAKIGGTGSWKFCVQRISV